VITLSSLRELKEVTALFSYLSVLKDDDAGADSFRILLLRLLAKYCVPEKWLNKLKPVTEDEMSIFSRPVAHGKTIFLF
jgi:hypothetical protein